MRSGGVPHVDVSQSQTFQFLGNSLFGPSICVGLWADARAQRYRMLPDAQKSVHNMPSADNSRNMHVWHARMLAYACALAYKALTPRVEGYQKVSWASDQPRHSQEKNDDASKAS